MKLMCGVVCGALYPILKLPHQIKKYFINPVVRGASLLALALFLLAIFPGDSFCWPTDSEWIPVLQDGAPVGDVSSDAQGGKNMVGDSTNPTAYIANDGTDFFFRIRLDDTPVPNGGKAGDDLIAFGWGVVFDTDGDASTYEWLIMVNGISNEEIRLEQNTATGTLNDPSDLAEVVTTTYPVSIGTNVRVSPAGSYFGTKGEEDYFLDWSIPMADMLNNQTTPVEYPGMTEESLFRLFFGTSSSAHSLATDFAGAYDDLSGGFSDPTDLYGHTPTDGAVAFVTDATGATTTTSAYATNDIFVRVVDSDRNHLPDSQQTLDVTLTTSTADTLTLTLTETGNDTGIFVGAAPSVYNAVADTGDAVLQVITGTTVDASYDEYTAPATLTTRVGPQLVIASPITIAKAVSSATALIGDTVTYTISITNVANGTAVVTQLTDTLASAFAYDASSTGGDFTALEPSISGDTLTWSGFTIPVLGNSTMTHTFDAITGGVKDSVYTNDAAVSGNNFTDISVTGAAPVTIVGPTVEITKAVDLANASPGDILTYSLSYRNNGTAPATSVILLDAVPAYTIYQSGTMKIGPAGADYASAESLTDADDGAEALANVVETVTATSNGTDIEITVENLPVAGSGVTFFQVQVQ